MSTNIAEAMAVLGVDETIIGIGDNYEKLNPYLDFADKTNVGTTGEVDLETIIELNPDTVLAFTDRPGPELEGSLNLLGLM